MEQRYGSRDSLEFSYLGEELALETVGVFVRAALSG
jgi:hypothetical protein